MEKLKELKKWCEENSEWQEGMDSDAGAYPSMEYIDLYELNKKIDELIGD